MKIIAERNYGYIVDMDKSELEKLTGFYYGNKKFKIGEKLKVDSLYSQLKSLVTQSKEIKKISHSLKTAAGMLDAIDPVFYEETKGE